MERNARTERRKTTISRKRREHRERQKETNNEGCPRKRKLRYFGNS
jgi:hypothetical protein